MSKWAWWGSTCPSPSLSATTRSVGGRRHSSATAPCTDRRACASTRGRRSSRPGGLIRRPAPSTSASRAPASRWLVVSGHGWPPLRRSGSETCSVGPLQQLGHKEGPAGEQALTPLGGGHAVGPLAVAPRGFDQPGAGDEGSQPFGGLAGVVDVALTA